MTKKIFADLFFYLVFPLLVWNFGREMLGNYYAVLIGTVPSLLYTIIDFIRTKETNITGLFFLSNLSLNFIFDLLSDNATSVLWNEVYISIISVVFYAVTILIKKPMGIYFFTDYAFARGIAREKSKKIYQQKENKIIMQRFTIFLMIREIFIIGVKSFMIKSYGINGFNSIQTVMTTVKIAFTVLIVIFVMRILKTIHQNKKLS